MLFEVDHRRMRELARTMENVVNRRRALTTPLVLAISARWFPELGSGGTTVIMWLMARTICLGRAADRLTMTDMVEGIQRDGEVYATAIGMSRPTLRKHINDLCEADFINIYRVGKAQSGEVDARMYEINCKKMLDEGQLETVNLSISDALEEAKTPQKRGSTSKFFTPTRKRLSSELIDKTYINFVNSHTESGLGKPNLFPAGFAAPGLDGETMTLGNTVIRLATPKKARATVQRSESIADIISTTQQRYDSGRAARAASIGLKSISSWEMKDVQAVIDKAMKETRPDYPRMLVTGKAFSVFKKRMREAQITDVNEFVSWCIQFWGIISERNRKAHSRKIGNGATGTPIPNAPEFTAFAYRLPYFIKVFAEGRASLESSTLETAESQEVKRLKAKLAQVERDNAAKEGIIRRMNSRPTEKPSATRRVLRSVAPARDDGDYELPAWEES